MYKLTNQHLQTHEGFQWELGKKEVIKTVGGNLCTSNFFHYYSDPLLAVFLNPIHAKIKKPRLFTVEVGGEIKSALGLKFGAKEMTLVEELELPKITKNQKIAFGILCALEVCKEPDWIKWATGWATGWLDGTDRSKESANAARAAANYAVDYAARAAAAKCVAYNAAYAAFYAANYAVDIDLIELAKKAMEY